MPIRFKILQNVVSERVDGSIEDMRRRMPEAQRVAVGGGAGGAAMRDGGKRAFERPANNRRRLAFARSRDPMKSRLPGPRQQPVHHHLTWIAATAWKLMLLHRLRGEVCRLILTLPLVARKGHPFPNGLPSNLLSFHLVAPLSRKSPLNPRPFDGRAQVLTPCR